MANPKDSDPQHEPTVAVYIRASVLKGMPRPRLPDPRKLYQRFIAQRLAAMRSKPLQPSPTGGKKRPSS